MAKAKRKELLLLYVNKSGDTETFEKIGKDNDELTRSLNNEVESKTNVLGETTVDVTLGAQVSSVDPCYYDNESSLAKKLKKIYEDDLELDDVVEEFIEVDMTGEATENEYPCFRQKAAIDLKSWGGDTKGISTPYDLNWVGAKTKGTFNPVTKKFTPTVTV